MHRAVRVRIAREPALGTAQTAHHLHLNISTVPCNPDLLPVPAAALHQPCNRDKGLCRRYEYARSGHVIHMDVRTLGRTSAGAGHRVHARVQGETKSWGNQQRQASSRRLKS